MATFGVLLNVLGNAQPFLSATSPADVQITLTRLLDVQLIASSLLVMASLLLRWLMPSAAAAWLVGTGGALIAVEYAYITAHVLPWRNDIAWPSLLLRTCGVLLVGAAVGSARTFARSSRSIDLGEAVVLLTVWATAVGGIIINLEYLDAGYRSIAAGAVVVLGFIPLQRRPALGSTTLAGPALLGTGLVGLSIWMPAWRYMGANFEDHEASAIAVVTGFTAICAVGVWRCLTDP